MLVPLPRVDVSTSEGAITRAGYLPTAGAEQIARIQIAAIARLLGQQLRRCPIQRLGIAAAQQMRRGQAGGLDPGLQHQIQHAVGVEIKVTDEGLRRGGMGSEGQEEKGTAVGIAAG